MNARAHRPWMIAALLWGGASLLEAQRAPLPFLDVQSSAVGADGVQTSAFVLAPGLSFQSARAAGWLQGSTELRGDALSLRTFDSQARSTFFRAWRLDVGAGLRTQYDAAPNGSGHGRLNADLRFATRSAARGVSAGVGVAASAAPSYRFAATTARVGGWIRALGLAFSGEITTGHLPVLMGRDTSDTRFLPSDTMPQGLGGDTISGSQLRDSPGGVAHRVGSFATEARLMMSTRVGGVSIDGHGGLFLFRRAAGTGYGSVTATQWVTPRMAVMAGVAYRAVDPGEGLGRSVALFGVRVAPRRVVPRIVDAPPASSTGVTISRVGEQVTIELRAPGATSVELAGDFTKWSPVNLTHVRGDRWTMSLRLAPGVYRIHVRVDDGEWAPPPGVSRMVDAYEGTVGVLVVS